MRATKSTRPKPVPQPGMLAHLDTECGLCDRPIVRNKSRIVGRRNKGWVHVECAVSE